MHPAQKGKNDFLKEASGSSDSCAPAGHGAQPWQDSAALQLTL